MEKTHYKNKFACFPFHMGKTFLVTQGVSSPTHQQTYMVSAKSSRFLTYLYKATINWLCSTMCTGAMGNIVLIQKLLGVVHTCWSAAQTK